MRISLSVGRRTTCLFSLCFPVYSNACAVWSVSLHGSVISTRNTGRNISIQMHLILWHDSFLNHCLCNLVFAQFFDRLRLFGMPAKHQPDFIYLRHVPLRKVHLFTIIQLSCLVLLWVIKTSRAAIVFPMMVPFVLPANQTNWIAILCRLRLRLGKRPWLHI